MKKLLSFLLATILLLTCIPVGVVSVSAEDSSGDYYYTVTNGKATITDYFGSATKLVIPSKLGGYPVTEIGNFVFYDRAKITSVTIPDSITTIGEYAFFRCSKLKSVTLGTGIKTIGVSAFEQSDKIQSVYITDMKAWLGIDFADKLANPLAEAPGPNQENDRKLYLNGKLVTNLVIPDDVTSINDAFYNYDKLTSVVIGKKVTTIKEGAFFECNNLSWVYMPASVKKVGDIAFGYYYVGDNCFKNIYYGGTKAQKSKVRNEYGENPFDRWEYGGITWHYNCSVPCKTHTYEKTVTKATATADGSIKHVCTKCKYVAQKVTTINKASKVSLSKTTYTYSGKAVKPTVTVKDSKGKAIAKSNYTVTYASGRKNVGTYKVTVKFKGNYSGTKTLSFTIVPHTASINKLTAKSKAIDVKLNRSLKQSTGYQIQYSTSSSFKNSTSKWITDYNKNTKTLTGLKAKTTYYVRVRTYKKIGDKFYYSNWSSAKKVKTK